MIGIKRTAHRRLAAGATLLGAGACALVLGTGAASGATSHAARTVSLNESGHLRETSHHGVHLNYKGTASGTVRGSIYIHLNATSPNRVSAEVNIYPRNGSLTGYSTASYRVYGNRATFSGSLSIARGTGTYAHAHASDLRFSGTTLRSSGATSVRLNGRLSY